MKENSEKLITNESDTVDTAIDTNETLQENIKDGEENTTPPPADTQTDAKNAEEAPKLSRKRSRNKIEKPSAPFWTRAADPEKMLLLCVLIGISAIAVYFAVDMLTPLPAPSVALIVAVLYILAALAIIFRAKLTVKQYTLLQRSLLKNGSIMTYLISTSDIPAVLTHDDGTVIWYNEAMRRMLDIGDMPIFGKKLNKYCPFDIDALLNATKIPSEPDRIAIAIGSDEKLEDNSTSVGISSGYARTANGVGGVEYFIGAKRYIARTYTTSVTPDEKNRARRNYNLTLFEDTSELFDLKDKLENENLVVAYIVLDNLEELAQYARVDYRMAANNIEIYLKEWAAEVGGILCEYDRDKYMLLISQENLIRCIESDFPILDKIRSEHLGNGAMSITISMGISGVGETISKREQNAQLALDTALRRGGDQIVIKKENEFDYFGGRSKSAQKREKVPARVNADALAAIISGHSQIMIMGHKNPDCDSIGACVGMSRFVRSLADPGTTIRIIVNTANDTFLNCTADIRNNPEYKNMFIDGFSALDSVTSDTLLIIVDANNINIIECSDIARSVSDIVIIDHHRKTVEHSLPVLLEYIEPSASSASELITEMIESKLPEGTLLNEEANVLLAGIMLDTMNFTRTSGVRTYSAAYYLRSSGAMAEKARIFFEDDLTQHLAEAKFFTPENITTFRDCIAVAISMGTDPAYDRIAAAKAAERLVATRNIEAAFALVKINESIVISARSSGKINVQLILESLHGGGHFDSAGAQVNGKTMNEVLVYLRSAINNYFED